MKELWAKSNIWILTAAGIAVAAYMALAWDAMPAGQRALGFFVVGIVLHEWEEMRFPGGFYDLMTRKFGIEGYTQQQAGLSGVRDESMMATSSPSPHSPPSGLMRGQRGAWSACVTPGQRRTPYAWSSGLLRYPGCPCTSSPSASAGGKGFAGTLYGSSTMRHSAADVLPSFVIRPALRSDWSR